MSFPQVQKGFTLIEVLLYITLVVVLMGALGITFFVTLQSGEKNEALLEVERQGAFVMDMIIEDIREARAIITPATSTTDTTLSFDTASTTLNPTQYLFIDSTLYKQQGGGIQEPLTHTIMVNEVSFENITAPDAPSTLRIMLRLTGEDLVSSQEYQRTFYGTATLRQ